MSVLRVVMVPEDGALVEAALASAVEHLSDAACRSNAPAGASHDSESDTEKRPRPTRVEALVELARSYLSTNSIAPSVEHRHLVMLGDVGGSTTRRWMSRTSGTADVR